MRERRTLYQLAWYKGGRDLFHAWLFHLISLPASNPASPSLFLCVGLILRKSGVDGSRIREKHTENNKGCENEWREGENKQQEEEQKLRKWLWGKRDFNKILWRHSHAFIWHLIMLLNKSTDAIKVNRFIMCNSDYITRSNLSQFQNKSTWQMKSISQNNDFPSSNSSLLHCWCVRLSSSVPSMVECPSIETQRTKSFWIHGDASPGWITRKSGNIHQSLLLFSPSFLHSSHPPSFVHTSFLFTFFPQNI